MILVACQYFIIFIVPLQVTGEVHLHQPRDQSQIEPLSHLGREITVDRQGRIGQAFDGGRVAGLKSGSNSDCGEQTSAYPMPALLTTLRM